MEPPPPRSFQGIPISLHDDPSGLSIIPSTPMQVDMPEPPASGKGHAPHRGRYKEKFASMREKHDKATRVGLPEAIGDCQCQNQEASC
ncbi:hypothetical protein FA13DRAFT_196346 [Coprinellus micaceus]|uniref:Uncharacterized protein n=1 Tax=Coprinellus micaceus TaxID=71717 RepID=A0A4Y7TGE5_COPMI|nr:hypothetical protein FA13DRAFT_196346 [Coprinellus micaceus]